MNWLAWLRGRKSASHLYSPRRLALEPLENRSLLAGVASALSSELGQAAVLADDAYEQNDTRGTSRPLGTVTAPRTINGLVMADASDWYRFRTSTRGTASDFVEIDFEHAQGDLDLALFNSSGQRVGYAGTTSDTERVSLSGLAAGLYYVRIYGYRGATNPDYSLTISPRLPLVDDAYEQNDSRAAARDLGALTDPRTMSSLVMADSHDWFRFSMDGPGASGDGVAIDFLHSQGNLGLELYNAAGTRIASVNSTTSGEQISLSGRPAGTYYVHVHSAVGVTNPSYALTIDPGVAVVSPPTPDPGTGQFDIQFVFSGLNSAQRTIFRQAAQKWESIIVGDLPSATYNGQTIDDVVIHASATPIDGRGDILGQAGPDRVRSGSLLPYAGSMEFDSADMASMQSNGTLLGVILHEMGHVLGIGTIWKSKGLVAGARTSNSRFTGPQATAEFNRLFGQSRSGVPLETGGGAGTRDSHWRESLFRSELMTGWVGPGSSQPISRITVASLADIGYTVNMAAADRYTPPGLALAAASDSLADGLTSGSAAVSLRDKALPIFASSAVRMPDAAAALDDHRHVSPQAELRPAAERAVWESAVDSVLGDWLASV
jgi:hypothetical protein